MRDRDLVPPRVVGSTAQVRQRRERHVLKKLIIAGVVAATATLGIAGIAHADIATSTHSASHNDSTSSADNGSDSNDADDSSSSDDSDATSSDDSSSDDNSDDNTDGGSSDDNSDSGSDSDS
jgi:cytoskeletal protein RodZ